MPSSAVDRPLPVQDALADDVVEQAGELSEERLRGALLALEELVRPTHPALVRPLWRLARFLDRQGRAAEAERLYRRALAIAERHRPATSPLVPRLLCDLASLWCSVDRAREAEPLLRRAARLCPEGPAVLVGDIEHHLAWTLHRQRELVEAEVHYHAALLAYANELERDAAVVGDVCHNLGLLLVELGCPEDARQTLWRAARARARHRGRSLALTGTLRALAELALTASRGASRPRGAPAGRRRSAPRGELADQDPDEIAAERLLQRALFCLEGAAVRDEADERRRRSLRQQLAVLYDELGHTETASRLRRRD